MEPKCSDRIMTNESRANETEEQTVERKRSNRIRTNESRSNENEEQTVERRHSACIRTNEARANKIQEQKPKKVDQGGEFNDSHIKKLVDKALRSLHST